MRLPWRQLLVAMGLSLLVPPAIGLVLDHLLDSAPLALFISCVISIVAGTVSVVYIITRQIGTLAETTLPAEGPTKGSNGMEDRA